MQRLTVPAEFKASGNKGAFSGYASIFGNVDRGGDVIAKNQPFKEIVRNAEGRVLVLFQHDAHGFTESGGLPIGTADVEQNARGLKFEGHLVMDDPFVQRVHTHMRAGTLSGMSIGFDILPGGAKILESGVRELNALRLWEISAVTFGMNPQAQIQAVKSRAELEHAARLLLGLSKAKAKRLAYAGWPAISAEETPEHDIEEAVRIFNSLSLKS